MSSSSQTPASSSQFESIISTALSEFKKKTGKNLLDDLLAEELENCDSVEAVMGIIQGQAEAFDKFRDGDSRLIKWIRSSVHVLYTISAALGDGVGAVVPSAKAVFTGIGVLLAAAKDVRASHDALVDLFERIQFFLKRLGVHTRISPTKDMVEILVKIMAEVIAILSIATNEMQQSKAKIYLRKLLGRTDIEDALKKLDSLTQEEVRMAIAQVLQGINELKYDTKKAKEALREIKDDVEEIKWDQIGQDVQRWFSPPDPSVNYNTACESYHEGTARWFVEGSLFKEWELVGSLLWIHGKPGSGKSILSSVIIKHVKSLRDAGHASLAYFFFDFRDKDKKQDARNFLTSLLIQLSAHSDLCRKIISDIYSKHGKGTQQPNIGDLTKCLHDMLFAATQRPVYLIIDALDECPNISGLPTPRAVLLGLLEDLVDLRIPNLHICVTSRQEVDIKCVLEPLAYSAVSLHNESGQKKDISDYVDAVVNSDRKMRGWRDDDKKLVIEVLSKKADGMFRWVYCQLEVLQHCISASIRQILEQLPESLDETYARVLSQIPQANQAHAHRLLQCLMVAVRPLRVWELVEVLAFEFGTAAVPKYRADWRPNDQVQAVLSMCPNLITVTSVCYQFVQFSHFSVKEFLMSDRLTSTFGNFSRYQINPGPAHTILAQVSLGILHLDGHTNEVGVKSSPLAKYAAQHWVKHAQFEDVASRVKDGMKSLFDCDKPHFAAWVGIYNIDDPLQKSGDLPSKIPTPLYLSSLCGFSDLVEHLAIRHPQHVNAIGGRCGFPLHAAIVGKQAKNFQVDPDLNVHITWQAKGLTPAHKAFINIVQSLLNHGADVNRLWKNLGTPLHLAACHGELEVAQVLLEHKANVNFRDQGGMTPFQLMFEDYRRVDFLGLDQLLLKYGADVNIWDKVHNTPLHRSISRGRYDRAEILLKLGADPSMENDVGKTPLHLLFEHLPNVSSAREDYDNAKSMILDTVRLLLERGADMNLRMPSKWTLLHEAAYGGWPDIVKELLDRGANVNAETKQGKTPLHMVSRLHSEHSPRKDDYVGVAQLLVERGADVNARDEHQNTPLHSAALDGRPEIAQILLNHGASIVVENDQGKTPLHLVSREEFRFHDYSDGDGSLGITQLLLERDVDVNATDVQKNTPLHSAVFGGKLEIAKVLLGQGASADAKNDEGETPLHMVSSQRQYGSKKDKIGIAQLLLEHSVDVNARNKNQSTPFHLAAFTWNMEIARVLLDHGAIVDAENDKGETPLNLVSQCRHGYEVVRLLLERGVDVNTTNNNKSTPLHSAASWGCLETTQLLLDHGANAYAENDEGETPLHRVSQGHFQEDGVGIARLLLDRGVDVNARKKNNSTPLHLAAFMGRLQIAQVLLNRGANADAENDDGETPLNLVSRGKRYLFKEDDGVGIARLLLEHGVDVNAQKKSKTSPLHSAAFKGRLKIAQMLLDCGAIADAENDGGETPLNLVSRGEYKYQEDGVGIARLLLERGVDVNAQKKSRTTPLHSAAFKGRLKIAQMLLDRGAIADAENDGGETPLNLVSRGEYKYQEDGVGIARLLLERGVDVNAQKKSKTTPLHSAALKVRPMIARVLLDHGAIVDAKNDEGETSLNLVLRGKRDWEEGVVGIVRLLLKRGVDVNAQDKYHNTPLHLAAFKRKPQIARLLLDHGANPNAENKRGETLLHEVPRIEDNSRGVGIARLLLERGVDVHARDKDHNTALHSAAFEGKLRLAQILLDHGANPAAENDQGETPLHLALRGRHDSHEDSVSIAQLLLERGVDVNGRKRNKWTPLHLAAFKGRLDIARALLDHGANPNAADEQGETPLHVVSQGKYDSQEEGVRIARLLLEHGADADSPDKDQYTPFDSASYFWRFDIARLLLEHGATDAEPASRGMKRKAEDVDRLDPGSRSEKKPKLHEDTHLAPWRHAHFADVNN